jgi:hypothetical protein
MHYPIELTHSASTHTAVIRGRVQGKELARFVPAACGEVWSFIRSAGLPRPGRHLALYLDAQGSLPAGRVATTVHVGPYARLSDAHAALREWCAEHGHSCSGVSWELYGHWEESWNTDPSKIRTDVFCLLDHPKG